MSTHTGLTPEQIQQAGVRAMNEGYFHNVADQVDRLAWSIVGGKQDMTISAELAQKHRDVFLRLIAHALTVSLDFIQPHHVEMAAESDKLHAEAAVQEADKDISAASKEGI